MATVLYLFRAPRRRLSVDEVETAEAVTDFGFAGCAHAKKSSVRQLLLLDKETLDAMDLRSVASAKISPQKASIVNFGS